MCNGIDMTSIHLPEQFWCVLVRIDVMLLFLGIVSSSLTSVRRNTNNKKNTIIKSTLNDGKKCARVYVCTKLISVNEREKKMNRSLSS